MNRYEMMVLFDTGDATKKWEELEELLRNVLSQHGAVVSSLEKWGDRKLAYEIKKVRRATYALTYFEAEAGVILKIDRDLRLKERVLRHMILRDDRPEEDEEDGEEAVVASASSEGSS